jgi:hypothetical protein
MKPTFDFSPLCQSFFSKRLMGQSKASPHTISAYAQMFRLLLSAHHCGGVLHEPHLTRFRSEL